MSKVLVMQHEDWSQILAPSNAKQAWDAPLILVFMREAETGSGGRQVG